MKHLLYTILSSALLLFACSDYLDMTPEKDIDTIETIFEQRTSASDWLVGIYGLTTGLMASIGENVAYLGTDEFVTCDRFRNFSNLQGKYYYPGFKISDGLQMSQDPYDNLWEQGGIEDRFNSFYELIRSCNIFIENIDNVYNMLTSEKRQWKAEVKAIKAFIYFELVRRYGPIVLVPKNIGVDEDMSKMQQPRVHVDTCFNTIVRLLDEAVSFLPTSITRDSDRAAFFCKESALALKARVLLYAASPLFNGNEYYSDFKSKNGEPLFSIQKDPEKWKRAAEAADEAVRECEYGHRLYNGTSNRSSNLLNTMGDIELSMYSTFSNPEFLLEWKYTSEGFYKFCLPRFKSSDLKYFNEALYGCLSPSMKMVEMYYTEHGLPIDADNTWNYNSRYQMSKEASSLYKDVVPLNTDVLQLHLRREPRFYACIAADRLYWQLGTNTPYVNYNLLVKAYKGEQFGSQYDIVTSNSWQNINGYWLKKHTYSNWAIKTYHENIKRNETLPIIRLAELYLIQAEAWNEYLEKPDDRVYAPLNKVRKRAGIPDVVTAWKSTYSKNPEKVDSREGMREIIRQEINIELAFEGHRYWNLRRWKIAHEKLNEKQYGWNILGETERVFYNNFEGPVVIWNKCKFTAPRDYLNPIRAEQVLISGVVQNPGW